MLRDDAGKEIRLDSSEVSIGRGDGNTVAVNGIGVSRKHAKVFYMDDAWHVQDLGSTNGTRVNNSNITRTALADGDTVAFGRVCYKFIKLDTQSSSRSVDLGTDQTLILRPDDRAKMAAQSGLLSSAHPGTATRPRKPVRPTEDSNVLMWVAVVLAVLLTGAGIFTSLN